MLEKKVSAPEKREGNGCGYGYEMCSTGQELIFLGRYHRCPTKFPESAGLI